LIKHVLPWTARDSDDPQASTAPPENNGTKRRTSARPLGQDPAPVPGVPANLQRTVLSLATALSLYGLKDSELFWELQLDTRCLMGWNTNKIVVSFRGTASMRNAVADMQVGCGCCCHRCCCRCCCMKASQGSAQLTCVFYKGRDSMVVVQAVGACKTS